MENSICENNTCRFAQRMFSRRLICFSYHEDKIFYIFERTFSSPFRESAFTELRPFNTENARFALTPDESRKAACRRNVSGPRLSMYPAPPFSLALDDRQTSGQTARIRSLTSL